MADLSWGILVLDSIWWMHESLCHHRWRTYWAWGLCEDNTACENSPWRHTKYVL